MWRSSRRSTAAVFLAVIAGVYGWLVGTLWTPFLFAGRVRDLFSSLPGFDWSVNYALWIPVPAVLWGFVFGVGVSVSSDVRSPPAAAPLYVAGVDGTAVATAISLVAWPVFLLYLLPTRGLEWYDDLKTTTVLVVVGVPWYFSILAATSYVLSVFAGFGQVMSGG